MSEDSENFLDQLLDRIAHLDDSLAAFAEGKPLEDSPATLQAIQTDLNHLSQALHRERQTPCSVCGQNLPDGVSRCGFCGAQAPQRAKVAAKISLVSNLEQEIQKFESGLSELAVFIRFVHQEFRRVVLLGSKNTVPSQSLTKGIEQISKGYTMLLEVESPGDTRIYRGLDLVVAGADALEALT